MGMPGRESSALGGFKSLHAGKGSWTGGIWALLLGVALTPGAPYPWAGLLLQPCRQALWICQPRETAASSPSQLLLPSGLMVGTVIL